jgi:hypothetical protein
VGRPEPYTAVFLTFDGLREARGRDRDTRVRIALRGPLAGRLWRLLGEQLSDKEKLGDKLPCAPRTPPVSAAGDR